MFDDTQTDEMKEIVEDFLQESEELIEKTDQDLVTLENTPNDLELLNQIFRSMHTIKGTAGFIGFSKMTDLAHQMETILNKLRKEELVVNSNIMDHLLDSVDLIKIMLEDIREGKESEYDLSGMIDKLRNLLHNETSGEGLQKKEDPGTDEQLKAFFGNGTDPSRQGGNALTENDAELEKLQEEDIEYQTKRPKSSIEQTIRVDVNRLDDLMNLVGELVLGKTRLIQVSRRMELAHNSNANIEDLTETCSQIGLVTNDLQTAVMKTRLIPIGKVFNKFPRMIRDLARDMGKEIQLEITGEDTELDKAVVEKIGDPLVHILRNSANHGIESAEEREQCGKPKAGTISLSAYYEGNHVVVKTTDDGRGIDTQVLKTKAVEMGFISEAEASGLTKEGVLNLIFIPGFSTAKVADTISGRGVGMDVVRNNIKKLNGLIELESEEGVGTTILLKIPLTLAIVQALLVKVHKELFAIPIVSIVELESISPHQIQTIDKKEVLHLRDSIVPLLRLCSLFDVPSPNNGEKEEKLYVVIIGLAEKRIGLIVNSVVGQEEVVIKSMGTYLSDIDGIAGATIMGDGHVTLIIDVPTLMNLAT